MSEPSENIFDTTGPLVSAPVDVSELQPEYAQHDGFSRKAKQLIDKGFLKMRRCRRDGNCFFRGFSFGYLEHALNKRPAAVDQAKSVAKSNYDALAALYPPMVFEDFHDLLIEGLDLAAAGDFAGLQTFLEDASTSDCIVSLFRFITAAEIIANEELYQPFLPDGHSAHSFTQNEVLNMGRESEEVHLVALSKRMGINLRVIYMDASSPDLTIHDFFNGGEDGTASNEPDIQILYRPGHYDILYSVQA